MEISLQQCQIHLRIRPYNTLHSLPPRTPKVPPTSPLPPSTSESHLLPLNKSKALDQTASANRISNCSCEFSSSSSRNWVHAANQIYRSRSAGLCTQDIEIILHPPPGSPRLLETRYIGRCTLASPSVGALDSCPFHPLTQHGHKYILADPPSLRAGDQCKSGLAKHRYPAIKCVVFGAPLRTSEPNPSGALKATRYFCLSDQSIKI